MWVILIVLVFVASANILATDMIVTDHLKLIQKFVRYDIKRTILITRGVVIGNM